MATLTLTLTPRKECPGRNQQQIEDELRQLVQGVSGARIQVAASEDLYSFTLSDEGPVVLARHAAMVADQLRGLEGVGMVTSGAALEQPELTLRIDAARAADLGVSAQGIAETLRVATMGDHDRALPRLDIGQRQAPVVVRLPQGARGDLGLLRLLTVPGRGSVKGRAWHIRSVEPKAARSTAPATLASSLSNSATTTGPS